jgi:hypothetical protein
MSDDFFWKVMVIILVSISVIFALLVLFGMLMTVCENYHRKRMNGVKPDKAFFESIFMYAFFALIIGIGLWIEFKK